MVPVIYHPAYQDYNFGPEHPFTPARLEMILELLEALSDPFNPVTPPLATRADLLTVHEEDFIDQVVAAGADQPLPRARHFGLDTPDVPAFEGMDKAARALVGGTLHGARLLTEGQATKVLQFGGGFHHARERFASGFCIYNDLSVAIRHLTAHGFRVAYLEIDVNHGDGVQWIHYAEENVLTISLHESGSYLFPGTGGIHELGRGAGHGFKLNVPLEPYTMDAGYLEVFERVVPHALSWYRPDVLVVQCGADAHYQDPLAHLLLTTHAYQTLFHRIVALANRYAGGRALFTLGGGYDLDATTRIWTMLYLLLQGRPLPERLPEAWRSRWEKRLGRPLTPTLLDDPPDFNIQGRADIEAQNRSISRRLLEMAAPLWY